MKQRQMLAPHLEAQLVDRSLVGKLRAQSNLKVEWACDLGHSWIAKVCNRSNGTNCPYCSGQRVLAGWNDLATINPYLAAQLSDQSLVTQLTAQSNRKVWWLCGRGHTWDEKVCNRSNGCGCPYCSGQRVIIGETDMATTHPSLAAQLSDQSLATQRKVGSTKPVDWVCSFGHEWTATPHARKRTPECPYCSGVRVVAGETDLATRFPDLARQLVDRNLATTLHPYSNRVVAWSCAKGHVWDARVSSRHDHGCPQCAPTGFNPDDPAWFYLLESPTHLVFGITNNLEKRLKSYSDSRVLVASRSFGKGHDARAFEGRVKRELSDCRYIESEASGERLESLNLDCEVRLRQMLSEL